MSLKGRFDCESLDPRLEALDLMTSYYCTMRFLEKFQSAIFNPNEQNLSIKDFYINYLHSLNLVNTKDDLPEILTRRKNNPNESQAIKNLKPPMGLGSLAAYMSMNLGAAKEIVGDKLPNKKAEKYKKEWFLNEFYVIEDEGDCNPTISRVITRLRNAISHHNFKLRVPDSKLNEPDIRDRVEVCFYDSNGSSNNDFYAKASFRTIEKLMEKIRNSEYMFHSCPYFEGDITNFDEMVKYVEDCFFHFSRTHKSRGLRFGGLKKLGPEKAYEVEASSGYLEMSHSDFLKFEVMFSVYDKMCVKQYLDIPFINNQRHGRIMIQDELYELGEHPIDWMLNHEKSPLYRLDMKIKEMIDTALSEMP